MNSELGKPINILLVEDNEPDVVLTQEAFREAKISNSLHVVEDGVEALAFLREPVEQRDGLLRLLDQLAYEPYAVSPPGMSSVSAILPIRLFERWRSRKESGTAGELEPKSLLP